MFDLDARLAQDTLPLGDMTLCRVLLMNDRQYPWLILVPRRPDVAEAFQLDPRDQLLLHEESIFTARALAGLYPGAKLNVAALGNVVRQLHVHHVVRFQGDPTWPAPVWGRLPAIPYGAAEANALSGTLREALRARLVPSST